MIPELKKEYRTVGGGYAIITTEKFVNDHFIYCGFATLKDGKLYPCEWTERGSAILPLSSSLACLSFDLIIPESSDQFDRAVTIIKANIDSHKKESAKLFADHSLASANIEKYITYVLEGILTHIQLNEDLEETTK